MCGYGGRGAVTGAVTEERKKGQKLSRESGMKCNVARAQRPLASAAKVVEAGNRISVGPKPEDNYIENATTGERIRLRVERGTYVFDMEYSNGEDGSITLDSGGERLAGGVDERRADATQGSQPEDDCGEREHHRELGHEVDQV